MLALACAVVLSTAVPSPGAVLLARMGAAERSLLAQSLDAGAERELERDLDQARSRPQSAGAALEEPLPEPPRRPKKRARRLGDSERVLVDGHGKGYFLTWGIVDWAIAGQMWLIGTWLGLQALTFASLPDDGTSFLSRDEAQKVSWVLGAGSAALGLAGIVVALRAGPNLETFREIRAQERARLERAAARGAP